MCKVCDNDYENLEDLYIDNCNNIKIIPNMNDKKNLYIINCPNIKKIPNIFNLRSLTIQDCPNIKEIPNILNLKYLTIHNCQSIKEIPNIQSLKELFILSCQNITKIPNIKNLQWLYILQCENFNSHVLGELIRFDDTTINKFYKINQIKTWWKKRSYYIKNIDKIYEIIEWIEKKRMHPESKYFQKFILDDLKEN
jgi:hypothetical protein